MANQLQAPGQTKPAPKGSAGIWTPSDLGLLAWPMDPMFCTSQSALTAGSVYLMRAKMSIDGAISKVGLGLRSTAPAGLTNTFVGIYTQAGVTATRIALSADISASVNGVAASTLYSLAAATPTLQAGTQVLIAFLFGSATTAPTVYSGVSQSRSNDFIAAKQNNRQIQWSTGLTALPTTIDLSNASATSPAFPSLFVAA